MVAAAFHGHGKLVRTAERADEQGDQHRHQCLDAVHELAVIQHCAAGFLGVHDLFGLIDQQRDKPQGDRHHHGKLMHRQVQLGKGFQQRLNGIRQHNGAGGVGQQAGAGDQCHNAHRHQHRIAHTLAVDVDKAKVYQRFALAGDEEQVEYRGEQHNGNDRL